MARTVGTVRVCAALVVVVRGGGGGVAMPVPVVVAVPVPAVLMARRRVGVAVRLLAPVATGSRRRGIAARIVSGVFFPRTLFIFIGRAFHGDFRRC